MVALAGGEAEDFSTKQLESLDMIDLIRGKNWHRAQIQKYEDRGLHAYDLLECELNKDSEKL